MTTTALTSLEGAALDSLREQIRVERLLAIKRRAYRGAVLACDGVSAEWVVESQAMLDAAEGRLAHEGLTHFAV